MRKSIIVILAVAIIGALGIYSKDHGSPKPGVATPASTSAPVSTTSSSGSTRYKDGTYIGNNEDTPYGAVRISVIVSSGKIADVNFLRMPNDRGHTQEVTSFSEPLLKQTTLQKQNANIDFVSGATTTSEAYQQSLQSALNQAALG